MKPEINFICVGAQKSGTTSLYYILKQHEDVYMATSKEAHFFDEEDKYVRGLDWYYETFFGDYAGEKICGEITPEYMYFENVPERIHQAFGPDIKLIFIMRNPASRAFSHYLMSKKRNYETLPFEEAIALESSRIHQDAFHKSHYSYVTRGFYTEQIKRYLQYFPKENMFFIRFEEDFVKNRKQTIVELCSFLGINGEGLDVDMKANVAKTPRYKWIPKFIYKPDAAKRLVSFLPSSLRQPVMKAGYKFALKENVSEKLPPEVKARLLKTYEADIQELERLIGKDLSAWKA